MASERTNKYWARMKMTIGVPIIGFVFAIFAAGTLPAGVDDSEFSFSTYPLRSLIMWVFVLSLQSAPVLFWHSLFKDKQELSKDFPDVKQRHWITIGVFSYFTAGIYPLWYLCARYKRTRDETTDGGSTLDSFLSVITLMNVLPSRWLSSSDTGRISTRREESPSVGVRGVTAVREWLDRSDGSTQRRSREDDAPTLWTGAENTVTEGDAAREDAKYQSAIAAYETALAKYEEARVQAETDE